jgi:hypothetical protein
MEADISLLKRIVSGADITAQPIKPESISSRVDSLLDTMELPDMSVEDIKDKALALMLENTETDKD